MAFLQQQSGLVQRAADRQYTDLVSKYLRYQRLYQDYQLKLKRTKLRLIFYRKQRIHSGVERNLQRYTDTVKKLIQLKLSFVRQNQ